MIIIALLIFAFFCVSCGKNEINKKPVKIEAEKEKEIEPHLVPKVTKASISVTGDLMVHSYQYEEAYDKNTNTYDFMHNFKDIKKYFDKSDLVIGNLETVFAGEDVGYSDYPMFNSPDSFAKSVKYAGFDLLTTANNHCMDKWQAGLLRTIDILDENGINHIGTYKTQEDRDNILIKDINGIKFAFLSYTYGTNGLPVKYSYNVNIMSEELIKSDIKRAKDLNVDFVIVLPHMGNEYETYPRDVFKGWVDLMFEAGADVVLASHPHVLQPMEYRKIIDSDGSTRTGFVIYSLGNFISSQTTPPRNASIILNMTFEKKGNNKASISEVSFIPVWTQFRGTDGQDNFVVRSVYEMLKLSKTEQKALLRQKDIERLIDIHYETTSLLLGEDIPIENIQNEYKFVNK